MSRMDKLIAEFRLKAILSSASSACPQFLRYSAWTLSVGAFLAALYVIPWKRLAREHTEKNQADE